MRLLINERIKESGIAKAEIARRMGISASDLSKRLNGYTKVDMMFLEKLADALGISVVSLMEDERCVQVATYKSDGFLYEVRRVGEVSPECSA